MSDHIKLLSKYVFLFLTVIFFFFLLSFRYLEANRVFSADMISLEKANALLNTPPD